MPSHTPGKRTIRFACRNCTTRLSAPLRAAGKTLRCPYCFTELVVPKESATVRREGYDLSEATEEPFVPTTEPAYVTVVCPVCATRMYATKDQIGQTMTCPDCGATAVVREPEPTAAPELTPPVTTEEYAVLRDQGQPSPDNREVYQAYIPVVCPTCETRMLATERDVGQEIACPDCQTRVRVPPLAIKAPSQPYRRTAEEREDDYDVGRGRTGRGQSEFLLVCGVCHTRLYATRDQVGHEILCPDCYTPILVPEAPAAAETGPEEVEAYDVTTSAPPPLEITIPGYEPIVDDGPLRRKKDPIEERRERELAEQSQRPRKRRKSEPLPTLGFTFFSGVFNFPFYHGVWNRWIGLSGGMFGVVLIAMMSSIAFVCFAAVLLASFLAWFMVTMADMLDIVRDTAAGADEVEPTEQLWMDRLFECLFPLFALGVAVLPAVGLAQLGMTMPWIAPACVFFLFPVVLLSMMANGSPVIPFSPSVFASLLFSCRAWAVFYGLTFLMGAAIAMIGWLLSLVTVLSITLIGGLFFIVPLLFDALVLAVALVWAMLVYSRLLGRLAWYCSQGEEED